MRAVRKNLKYLCRDDKSCTIDKRQRNSCKFCRYQKCLLAGMKKKTVQDERKRPAAEEDFENPLDEMPVVLEADKEYDGKVEVETLFQTFLETRSAVSPPKNSRWKFHRETLTHNKIKSFLVQKMWQKFYAW